MHAIIQSELIAWLRGHQWLAQNGYFPKAHAILSDPPYFLASIAERFGKENAAPTKGAKDGSFKRLAAGFMAQQWDSFESMEHFQQWCTEWGTLMLDFVHPGAIGMFCGGPRTAHRLAVGLEDAGWEIVDVIMWVTAQGLSKGTEVTRYFEHNRRASYRLKDKKHLRLRAAPQGRRTADGKVAERLRWLQLEKNWSGYKPTLKPAYEPIVVVRAPRQRNTYADCAMQYGTAHFNIDRSRVNGRYPANVILQHAPECGTHCVDYCPARPFDRIRIQAGGDVSGDEPSVPAGQVTYGRYDRLAWRSYADEGSLARFFFTPKAPTWERVAGLPARSNHPTVKPIQLTEYLARLLLPPESVDERRILVPFAGVGSEMIGAHLAGWDVITGIEMGADYVRQARQRLEWWSQYRTHQQAEEAFKSAKRGAREAVKLTEFGQLELWN